MTAIITLIDEDLEAGWRWVKTEAIDLYKWGEPFVAKALKDFEATLAQNLWGAAASFVSKLTSAETLANIETAFLNTVELLSSNLLVAAQTLGSNLLQTILGALMAHVQQA
jgi:hypothetical protein